jgi:hypothetical protein
MRAVTIQLDEEVFAALEAIARENGLPAAETLVSQQVQRLVSSYRGRGLTPGLQHHLQASIEENRCLLERLAQ